MNKIEQRLREIRERNKDGLLFRTAEVVGVDAEARTCEVSFSSEVEVPRWFGVEVLSHDPGAVRMNRLQDGAAVLWMHDWRDQRGVVESARIDGDRKGRAVLRFSRSAEGEKLMQDVADRIVTKISVGYFVHAARLTEEREEGDVITVTDWEPYEISFVSIPADATVGVGRSAEPGAAVVDVAEIAREESAARAVETAPTTEQPVSVSPTATATEGASNKMDENELQAMREAERRAGSDAERARIRAINTIAERIGGNLDNVGAMARAAHEDGSAVEVFQGKVLEALNARVAQPLNAQSGRRDIGMSDGEVRNFSFMRAARALLNPTDKEAQRAAAFEMEASEAARAGQTRQTENFVIPTDVLRRSVYGTASDGLMERAPFSTTTSGGGNSIATHLMAASFIDILRNRATILRMGSVMGGLVGNFDIPKQNAAAQGYWLGEDADATETGIGLGMVSMSPKTVAAYSEITRKLLMQSSLDVEALVRRDLAVAMALTMDKAGYYGTGVGNQPLGLTLQSGINAVDFAVAGQPTYAELVAMETEIAVDNADVDSMAYVGNARFRGWAKTTRKFPDAVDGGVIWEPGKTVNGYRTEITNQVADGDVVMGNFADLLIGLWGGLELTVDPFSGSKAGRLRLVVFQDCDFQIRRAESFCLGRAIP